MAFLSAGSSLQRHAADAAALREAVSVTQDCFCFLLIFLLTDFKRASVCVCGFYVCSACTYLCQFLNLF